MHVIYYILVALLRNLLYTYFQIKVDQVDQVTYFHMLLQIVDQVEAKRPSLGSDA